MKMRRQFFALASVLGLVFSLPVAAQTPDELTPNMEDICDQESITGAAWGLCNAYCEAMDCELANDGDPVTEPNASAKACDRVGSKFAQLTGNEPPCEVAPLTCPCVGIPEYLAQLNNADALCTDLRPSGTPLTYIGVWGEYAMADGRSSVPACGYNLELDTEKSMEITAEQLAACADELMDQAAAMGLSCN